MAESNPNMLRNVRIVLWVLVLIVGVASTAFFLLAPPKSPIGNFPENFSIPRTDGTPFTKADLVGTPTLMYFGYTFCPDVCPTTLAEMIQWRKALDLTPDQLKYVFITVDPERDTPEALAEYAAAFGDIITLRGDEAQTETMKKAYGVVAEKYDDPGASDYLVNHTASVFMIDKNGNFVGTISYGEATNAAMGKIEALMNRG
ncbi:MAG: SCO family protein [Hyphomicrobiaceae bacterium]|nr:SCO family protein [Hyphomicrobiaceae bacterium]MCC0023095.1 SCO family protein [Hyphomicrobiaceae bacterium]